MHIGLLTSGTEPDADRRFEEAATARGHRLTLLEPHDFSFILGDRPRLFCGSLAPADGFDLILPRIDIPHTEYSLAVLNYFHAQHIYAPDNAAAIALGHQKLRSLQFLTRAGIPTPHTGFAHSGRDFLHILRAMGGAPIIIKLLEGTEGKGVFLAETEEEARRIFATQRRANAHVMLQEFIRESSGRDYRSFVIGGHVVASMRRVARAGEFRANVALGAASFAACITEAEEAMALRAARTLGLQIAGVDFVRSARGPLVIEVNSCPGFTGAQGIESATGADVAGAILDYAIAGKLRENANMPTEPVLPPLAASSVAVHPMLKHSDLIEFGHTRRG